MKKQIQTEARVVLYELRNDKTDSRVKCLGYEVAILSETGKVQESWQYESTELRWAREGYKTLIDTQARRALDDRSRLKPYKPNCRVPRSPGIVRAAAADGRQRETIAEAGTKKSRVPGGIAMYKYSPGGCPNQPVECTSLPAVFVHPTSSGLLSVDPM